MTRVMKRVLVVAMLGVLVNACGQPAPAPCAPGGRTCDGNTLISCSLDGEAFTETRCLASFQVCSPTLLQCVDSLTGGGGGSNGGGVDSNLKPVAVRRSNKVMSTWLEK